MNQLRCWTYAKLIRNLAKKRLVELQNDFAHPVRLLIQATRHYIKYCDELSDMVEMAQAEWLAYDYMKSGYLYGEVPAIVLWGKSVICVT